MSQEWRKKARCRTVNPELFDDEDETALVICERCPVRVECLEYALNLHPKPEGIWGGTTFAERQGIKRGGHRASCPGCRSLEIYNDGATEVCISCGVAWLT